MGSFTCCIWWLVFGVLLGWLLAWWLNKLCCKKACDHTDDGNHVHEEEKPNLRQTYFSDAQTTTSAPTAMSRADMVQAASAAGISFSGKKNDLEIIEGIGPKIAELLNGNGIHTFAELSRASIATLNLVLEQGGERFKLANPSTWAEQAELAAENRWQELKALQDNLDGGIKKS